MFHSSQRTSVLKIRKALVAASLGLTLVLANVPAALATDSYYPSEAYQDAVESVLSNPTELEFGYFLDAMLQSPRMANSIEYTILALRDHYTQRMDGFIDSNFVNPPPPSPPAPPSTTPPPPVVWPSEGFQQTVGALFLNPTEQEFAYVLDQAIGSAWTENYLEYIVLTFRDDQRFTQRVNDFVAYLVNPTP